MAFANISAAHDNDPKGLTGTHNDFGYYTVKSGTTIYKGSLVCIEYSGGITGYAVYASNTASEIFVGVAAETVVGDGTATIKVWKRGRHRFLKGTAAITDVGVPFYCDGGATGTPATVQSGTPTGPIVGYGYAIDGTTAIWVNIEPSVM
jgi:hypothetical protein